MKFLLSTLSILALIIAAYAIGQVAMTSSLALNSKFWLWFDGDHDANITAYYFLFFCIVICLAMFALADYNLAKPVKIKSSDIKYIQIPKNTRNKYGFPNNT